MFSVIFEIHPKEGKKDEYLGLAKHLKPMLEAIDGFVDNERFESKRRPGWLLSHSTWRDEKSVVRWRTQAEHHAAQEKGRSEIFEDYRLRVGDVIADTDPPPQAAIREQRFDETEVGNAKAVTLMEITPQRNADFSAQADLLPSLLGLDPHSGAIVEHDVFASIYNPGKIALLVGWKDVEAAKAWSPRKIDGMQTLRERKIRIVREYGRFDRREAPQFYPDVRDANRPKRAAPARSVA
jgi:heme-degrading monooxygenase HmoA